MADRLTELNAKFGRSAAPLHHKDCRLVHDGYCVDAAMRQHPRDYPINATAKAEWEAVEWEHRGSGLEEERQIDWCWEKIAQLSTALDLRKQQLAKLRGSSATLPPPCSPVPSGSSASDATP